MKAIIGLLCLILIPFPVYAQSQLSPEQLAQDMVSPDFRRARNAEEDIMGLNPDVAIKALLAIRAKTKGIDKRARCDRVIGIRCDDLIKTLTENITNDGYAAVIALGGAAGAHASPQLAATKRANKDADVDPELTPAEQQRRSLAARRTLRSLGPAITDFLLRIPPLRNPDARRALYLLARDINQDLFASLASMFAKGQPKAAKLALEQFNGNADLMAFTLSAGIRHDNTRLRELFQSFRDAVLKDALVGLSNPHYPIRRAAENWLFRLSNLSKIHVEQLSKDSKAPPARRQAATALLHRIVFRISPTLYEKLGRDYREYRDLDFRARREVCLEIERLGGVDGIPTLRAIMRLETSREVRLIAALSLARLGDPIGIYWLQREGLKARNKIPKSDLIAIYMDQGIKYLTIGRYQRAEREFLRVLKLASKNETALYNLACVYSLWGKIDKALDMLEKAVENGFDDLSHIESDPDLNNIRQAPRYKALIQVLQAKKREEGAR